MSGLSIDFLLNVILFQEAGVNDESRDEESTIQDEYNYDDDDFEVSLQNYWYYYYYYYFVSYEENLYLQENTDIAIKMNDCMFNNENNKIYFIKNNL